MKIAFFTNLRAPYRTLQLNEYMKDSEKNIDVFYTDDFKKNRKWETGEAKFKEYDLRENGIINYLKLYKTIKKYDVIIIGGYYKIVYVFLSLFSKLLGKPCILLFDGISTDRLNIKEKKLKFILKKFIVNNSDYIFGNGEISKRYFRGKFKYPEDRIYNQYLSVDINLIKELSLIKNIKKIELKKNMNIEVDKKVIIYSGRLVEIKNVDLIVEALNRNPYKDSVHFLIVGGGELENNIKEKCLKYGISVTITGFLSKQEEVFDYYNTGDLFILPSKIEPWGLVVQEAMAAGLPILVSKTSGCVLDFVKEGINGFSFDPNSSLDLNEKITKMFLDDSMLDNMSKESVMIAENWTFQKSNKELNKIIHLVKESKESL